MPLVLAFLPTSDNTGQKICFTYSPDIVRISPVYPMLVPGPAECRAVCVLSCVETRYNVVHGD